MGNSTAQQSALAGKGGELKSISAAWGNSILNFPHPIGSFITLDDRGTASAGEDNGLVPVRNRLAQVKGTCRLAGACGRAGLPVKPVQGNPFREPDALGPAMRRGEGRASLGDPRRLIMRGNIGRRLPGMAKGRATHPREAAAYWDVGRPELDGLSGAMSARGALQEPWRALTMDGFGQPVRFRPLPYPQSRAI